MKPLKKDSKPLEQTSSVKTHKVVYGRPQEPQNIPKGFLIVLCSTFFILGISADFLIKDFLYDEPIVPSEQAQEFLEGKESATLNEGSETIDYAQFWEVWDDIKEYHIDQDATDAELFYGALRGMVRSTNDPYSDYFSPTEAEQFTQELEDGSFEGIGAEIGKKDDYLVVIAPLPGSPAETAGLRAGDIILKIDDEEAIDMSVEYGVYLIRGEKDTTVRLTVARDGEEKPIELSIQRNTIDYKSVEWEMIEKEGKKIALIELRQFNQDSAELMQQAVNEFLLEKPDGIILDMRNNGGGVVKSAVSIASLFLEEDTPVLIEQYFDGTEEVYTTEGTHPLLSLPTAVLVNGGSASASEIVAGALNDYDRAGIIGTTTFGKGTVQRLFPLEDNSLLKLTHAKWLTPKKQQINTIGITPDYVVEPAEDDFADEKDTQKDAAVLYLVDREAFEKKYVKEKE